MPTLSGSQIPPPRSWEEFQTICCDLWQEIWGDPNALEIGRQGQRQHGVDIAGQPKERDGWAGVQCKSKDTYSGKRLTKEELNAEVTKAKAFKPALSEFILATSGQKDETIQAEARQITERHRKNGLFSVFVWSWHDISKEIAKHPIVLKTHYPHLVPSICSAHDLTDPDGLKSAFRESSTSLEAHITSKIGQATWAILTKLNGANSQPLSELFKDNEEDLEVLEQLMRTCESHMSKRSTRKGTVSHKGKSTTAVIPPSRMRALGIIAVAPYPKTLADFKKLFPDVNWEGDVRYLRRRCVLASSSKEGGLVVPEQIKKALLANEDDERTFRQYWIDALEPLKCHPDTALYLANQYVWLGQFDKSVTTMVDIAEALEPGKWNEVYLSCLMSHNTARVLRRLTCEQRVRLYNSTGLCLTRRGDHKEAIEWFLRLRRYSKRIGDEWGIGQSYINCGAAYARSGDAKRAEQCYRKAIEHARENGDQHLLGRSLNNLATTMTAEAPSEAWRLLDESAIAKKEAGDRNGRVALYMGRGIIEAQAKNLHQALRWFRKSEATARKLDDRYGLSGTLCNIGTAKLELGEQEEAITHFKEARKLAEDEGFRDSLADALRGEALAREALKQHGRAEGAFRRLFDLLRDRGDWDGAVFALNAVGVMLLRRRKSIEARRIFNRAYELAREHELSEWAYKCRSDYALSYVEQDDDSGKAIRSLRTSAAEAQQAKLYSMGWKLWEDLVNLLAENDRKAEEVEEAFANCLSCLKHVQGENEARFRVLGNLHSWRWDNGHFDQAIDALRRITRAASRSSDHEWQCRALD